MRRCGGCSRSSGGAGLCVARVQPGSTRRYLQPRATQLRRNSSSHAAPAQVRGMVHSCIGKTPAPAAAAYMSWLMSPAALG
eukprot:scaffold26014_cov133-Isochrysis_galbana.AAC.1